MSFYIIIIQRKGDDFFSQHNVAYPYLRVHTHYEATFPSLLIASHYLGRFSRPNCERERRTSKQPARTDTIAATRILSGRQASKQRTSLLFDNEQRDRTGEEATSHHIALYRLAAQTSEASGSESQRLRLRKTVGEGEPSRLSSLFCPSLAAGLQGRILFDLRALRHRSAI